MRAIIQRVESASVKVYSQLISKITKGILVFIGVGKEDTDKDADYVASKIMCMRKFDDNEGKMNLSLADINGMGAEWYHSSLSSEIAVRVKGRHLRVRRIWKKQKFYMNI